MSRAGLVSAERPTNRRINPIRRAARRGALPRLTITSQGRQRLRCPFKHLAGDGSPAQTFCPAATPDQALTARGSATILPPVAAGETGPAGYGASFGLTRTAAKAQWPADDGRPCFARFCLGRQCRRRVRRHFQTRGAARLIAGAACPEQGYGENSRPAAAAGRPASARNADWSRCGPASRRPRHRYSPRHAALRRANRPSDRRAAASASRRASAAWASSSACR